MLRMLTAVGGQPSDDRHLAVGPDGLRIRDSAAPADP